MSEELALYGGPKTRDTSVNPWPDHANKSGRDFGHEEIELLTEVIQSGTLFRYQFGHMVSEFEREYAQFVGAKHCQAVTSGTAALHTAVAALQLEVGDEIITTVMTDMGSIIGILMQNHIPIFVDVDRRTLLMDTAKIEAAITDRTRAIMVVHFSGQPVPMDEVTQIADKYDLYVIEDCAQSHGAKWDGQNVGTIGHIGCFSLQQSKQITTGDGGMLVTDNDELYTRMRDFQDKYYSRSGAQRNPVRLGINYRMNELTGAVALAQTRKLPSILERRRHTAQLLLENVRHIAGIILPYVHPKATHSWWRLSFHIDQELLGCTSEEFSQAIAAEGLPFHTGYGGEVPICAYPVFAEHRAYGSGNFPWEPPYGRMVEYKAEDYPEALWAQQNMFLASWNEGFAEEDVADITRGLAKVVSYYQGK